MWSRDIIREGTLWKVGNGATINARKDAWIPSLNSKKITSNISYDSNVPIKEFITNHSEWDVSKINTLVMPFEAKAIQRIHTAGPNHPNSRYWRFEKSESYSVKTGYWNTFEKNKYPDPAGDKPSCSTKDSF